MERKWMIAIPILAVLLVVCALMTVIAVYALRDVPRWDVWNRLGFDGRPLGTVSVEEDQEFSYAVGDGASLVVENPCGKVDIRAVDGSNGMAVVVHKQVWVQNEEEGARALAAIQASATETPNRLMLEVEDGERACRTNQGIQFATVDFTVEVPVNTDVTARALSGDILLSGTKGEADLGSEFGSLKVTDTYGPLRVETVNGKVGLSGVDAAADAITVKSGFGSIQGDDILAGELRMETTNGTILIERSIVSGQVNLSSDFGGVTWNGGQADALEAHTTNGRIELSALEVIGDVVAESDFGAIQLQEVRAAKIDAKTKNGRVGIADATGPVTAFSEFGDIEVSTAEPAVIDLSTESGGISFEGSLGDGENRTTTKFGSVVLRLPKDSSFSFDLQTDFGKITSDFDMTITPPPNEKHWIGVVGEGGPVVFALTENGNISLEAR